MYVLFHNEFFFFFAVLLNPGEKEDTAQRNYEDQDRDVCEWAATMQAHPTVDPRPAQTLAVDQWQQPVTGLLSPVGSSTADSSTRPSAPQVTACLSAWYNCMSCH